ncbi:DUF72 domain-containing protein [Sphingomonas solaris]|uniref:DUF72 domain-containing protein n=1 Tax=Alterirhizorhabdus solaris TaxID=2529389 RepID=A0A558R694_9SPHN|nr:DUF72 domain-containing protein [Sphingomonas solaris]TVV74905.1 DUF72 domain-containing protein [Sphingomonas solaris]
MSAIRVGIGGWTYEPWRGTFYPADLPKTKEMAFAIAHMTAIEINATYYGSQKPATFARWGEAAPDGFVFAVKGSRYVTGRKVLAEAGESIAKFVGQGIVELGDRLGPILWQFLPTKRFDADDFAAFLALLPAAHGGVRLRHAVQVRHESFVDPVFVGLARAAGVAIVFADHADYPALADPSGDFIYARLEEAREEEPTGYDAAALDRWASVAQAWAAGSAPAGLPYATDPPGHAAPRDVFVFVINGAKVRAPAAAMALQKILKTEA